MICDNLKISKDGHLLFAGQDTVELAKKYGTPVYLMDEDKIREKCRAYKNAFMKYFDERAIPLYASKANSFKRIYEIMTEEGMGIDVVSSGEIYTAYKAGFDLKKAYFHSNNKTDEDIAFAMDHGVGYFVADNIEEVKAVEAEAGRRGIKQKMLLRLTPGIDPHTFEADATGKVDSKFGTAIETGQALEIVIETLKKPHIELKGFHCHVGSQVFTEDVFERAAVIMLEFVAECRDKLGYTADELDLGGGYGVRYVDTDPYLDIDTKVRQVSVAVKTTCERLGLELPEIHMARARDEGGEGAEERHEARDDDGEAAVLLEELIELGHALGREGLHLARVEDAAAEEARDPVVRSVSQDGGRVEHQQRGHDVEAASVSAEHACREQQRIAW
jgi:diaminopimelate decarboxylase